jgi:predicted nucleic acid-binding protein
VKPFLDTNILVYASLSDDPRRLRAEQILLAGGTISAQVLNEFTNVARGKLGWSWADIEATVDLVRSRISRVRPLTADTHAAALALARTMDSRFTMRSSSQPPSSPAAMLSTARTCSTAALSGD